MADPRATEKLGKIKVAATELAKVRKPTETRVKAAIADLEKAMAGRDKATIDGAVAAVDGEEGKLATAMAKVDSAFALIEDLRRDTAFVAGHREEIKAATATINGARSAYADLFKQIKEVLKSAKTAADSAKSLAGDVQRELASLTREVNDDRTAMQALRQNADAIGMKAAAARQAHDAAELSKQKAAMNALSPEDQISKHDGVVSNINEYAKKSKARKLGETLQAEVDDAVSDLLEKAKTNELWVKQAAAVVKDVREMTALPIDVARAAKELSLERTAETALRKVFDGPRSGWEAGLEAIAKQAQKKVRGRDMLATLRKAGVL